MDSRDKDKFAALVDSYFNDEKGCLEGGVCAYTFAVPKEYRDYDYLMPCDKEVQEKVISLLTEVGAQIGASSDETGPSSPSSTQGHIFGDVFAIRTTGDGDCLLHALSLCMWGREDHFRLLRGLLSLAFANPVLSKKLEELFVAEEKQRDVDLGFAGAREDRLLREEYVNAAARAFTVGTYLEGIHITCLSHILRRPIVVVDGDDGGRIAAASQRGAYAGEAAGGGRGETMTSSGQSMAGIYLPVLHSSSHCTRSPLVIAYTSAPAPPDESQINNPVIFSANTSTEMNGSTIKHNGNNSNRDHDVLPTSAELHVTHPSYVGHFTAVVGCDCLHPPSISSSGTDLVRTVPLVTTSYIHSLTQDYTDSNVGNYNKCPNEKNIVDHKISLVSMRVRYGPVRTSKHKASEEETVERRNLKLLHKYLDIETTGSESGRGQIFLTKQCLHPLSAKKDTESGSSCSSVLNPLLSSTSHHRRSSFLSRVLRDKEKESLRLEARLAKLRLEIHHTTTAQADCDFFISQSHLQEKRSFQRWRKYGQEKDDHAKKLHHHKSSSSSSSRGRHSSSRSSPTSSKLKRRSRIVDRTDSNESTESRDTSSTSDTISSRGSNSHRHRDRDNNRDSTAEYVMKKSPHRQRRDSTESSSPLSSSPSFPSHRHDREDSRPSTSRRPSDQRGNEQLMQEQEQEVEVSTLSSDEQYFQEKENRDLQAAMEASLQDQQVAELSNSPTDPLPSPSFTSALPAARHTYSFSNTSTASSTATDSQAASVSCGLRRYEPSESTTTSTGSSRNNTEQSDIDLYRKYGYNSTSSNALSRGVSTGVYTSRYSDKNLSSYERQIDRDRETHRHVPPPYSPSLYAPSSSSAPYQSPYEAHASISPDASFPPRERRFRSTLTSKLSPQSHSSRLEISHPNRTSARQSKPPSEQAWK